MQTSRAGSRKHGTKALGVVLALTVGMLAGCSGNPASGSAAYKEGELGNGDFLFSCDDGVACLPYSGDARLFPKAIATGSTFDVRFVAKNQEGNAIIVDGTKYEGIAASGVGPYISDTPDGFSAVHPGYGTIIVHDGRGYVVDYVTLHIVQPDTLIVYDASYDASHGSDPQQIVSATLPVDGTASYRVVAGYSQSSVAGSLPVEWSSDNPDIVAVESYSNHVVSVRARKAGEATLSAVGAGLTKTVKVEVTP